MKNLVGCVEGELLAPVGCLLLGGARAGSDRAPDTNGLDPKAEMPGWRQRVRLQPP